MMKNNSASASPFVTTVAKALPPSAADVILLHVRSGLVELREKLRQSGFVETTRVHRKAKNPHGHEETVRIVRSA